MKNKKRFFVMFLANTLLLVFLAPVSSHAFFQEVKSEFRYQGASVWQAVLDPLADMFEPWFQTSPKGTLIPPPINMRGEEGREEKETSLIINNPQTNTPSKQEVLNWIKDILKLQNTETYTSVPSQNIYNTYPTEIREIRTSGGSQGLADSLSSSLTNIDNRFTQITNTLTNSYTFLSPSLTNATLTGETTIHSHLLLSATSAPSTTSNRLYNTGGDLYWAGSLIGGATTGNWTSDGTNVWRSGGNVGVGSTTPGYKLSVNGSGFFDGGTVTASSFIATSSITAPSFNSTSAGTGFQISGTSVLNYSGGVLRVNDLGGGISLRTNSADRLFIDTAGLVGIGTTTPFASLSVNNIAGTAGFVVGSTTATSFIVDKNGNVGIGRTNPQAKLDLGSTSGVPKIYLYNDGTYVDGWGQYSAEMRTFMDTGGATAMTWGTQTNAGVFTQLMKLTTGGFLGLGTHTPGYKFDLGNYTANTSLALYNSGASVMGLGVQSGQFRLHLASSADRFSFLDAPAGNEIVTMLGTGLTGIGTTTPFASLSVNNIAGTPGFVVGSSTATSFIVDKNGNVGIGRANPSRKFEQYSTGNTYSRITTGLTGQDAAQEFYNGTTLAGNGLYEASSGGTGNWGVFNGGAVRMIVGTSGNVGIATTSPAIYSGVSSAMLTVQSSGASVSALALANSVSTGYTQMTFGGSSRIYNLGVGNASESSYGVANKWYLYDKNVDTMRMVVDTSGNTGIGTTTPWGLLSVNANALTAGTPQFVVGSSTATNFIVANGGNVGVGTTNPGAKLEVAGPGSVTNFTGTTNLGLMVRGSTGITDYSGIDFSGANITLGANRLVARIAAITTGTGSYLQFGTSNNYVSGITNTAMSIDMVGNVGIGTTSPMGLLDIERATSDGGVILKLGDKGCATCNFDFSRDTGGALKIQGNQSGFNHISLAPTSGNVGVGTTSPSAKLSVKGGGTTTGRAFAISDSSDNELFRVLDNGTVSIIPSLSLFAINPSTYVTTARRLTVTENSQLGLLTVDTSGSNANINTTGNFGMVLGQNGSTVVTILGAGVGAFANNMGIGTTTPWTKLGVSGTIATPGLVNDSTGFYACVNTTTGQLATSTTACGASSERFKENIQDLSYGLSEVLSLRPVSFDYKDSYIKDSTHQLGFIAEEVDLLIPELVAKDATGQIQGLDYPKFTSVIVKAVQELNGKFLNFVESLTKLVKTEEVQTQKLCVGETCIDEAGLRALLENQNVVNVISPVLETPDQEISPPSVPLPLLQQEGELEISTSTPEVASSTPTADIPDSDPLLFIGEVSVPSSVPLGEVSTTTPEL